MFVELLFCIEIVLEGCEIDYKCYRCSFVEEVLCKFLILYCKLWFKFFVFFLMFFSCIFVLGIRDFIFFNLSVELKIFYEFFVYWFIKELSFYILLIIFVIVIKLEVNLKDMCEVLNEEYDWN